MTRPPRFQHFRWLGDKRNLKVHDLDHAQQACDITGLAASGKAATFGPDVLAEARNRGFQPHRACVSADAFASSESGGEMGG